MSFAADVRKFTTKSEKAVDKTVRAITFALFREVIMRTPVDLGTLKGNWQASVNAPVTGTVTTTDKSGAVTVSAMASAIGGWGSTTFLTNNLPYAHTAEFGEWNGPTAKVTAAGFSRKADAGMVRVSLARINAIVAKATRENKV